MRKLKVEKVEGRLWQAQQAKVERILSTTSGGSWLGQRQNVQRLKKKKKKGEKGKGWKRQSIIQIYLCIPSEQDSLPETYKRERYIKTRYTTKIYSVFNRFENIQVLSKLVERIFN